jgi:cation transport protein ChaC
MLLDQTALPALAHVPDAGFSGGPAVDPDRLALSWPVDRSEPFWIFGYGSLIWNPGFPFAERHLATLQGYHRRFCIYSHRYRGTRERPGLVLGLDRGGSCRGLVFRVQPDHVAETMAYLWDREMVTRVYRPKVFSFKTAVGDVRAWAFVVDRKHGQYCGGLCDDEVARLIRHAHGQRGPNLDYLENTVTHLEEFGIRDRYLTALLQQVRAGA